MLYICMVQSIENGVEVQDLSSCEIDATERASRELHCLREMAIDAVSSTSLPVMRNLSFAISE